MAKIKNGKERANQKIEEILTNRYGFSVIKRNRREGGGIVASKKGETYSIKVTYSHSYPHKDIVCAGWHALPKNEIENPIFQIFIFVVEGFVNDLHYFVFKREDITITFSCEYDLKMRHHFYFRVKGDGKAVESRKTEKDISEFYNNWDRCFRNVTHNTSKHFAAYHNVDKMGHSYQPSEGFVIESKKTLKFLEETIGETVWVFSGTLIDLKKVYTLCAVFMPDQIIDSGSLFNYRICGSSGRSFNPQIVLNRLKWFPQFLRNQANFSLGINVIIDEEAVTELNLLTGNEFPQHELQPNDIDAFDSEAYEGRKSYIAHLRRERNRSLVSVKKAKVLDQCDQLLCETCGFDFHTFYGEVGTGFCEIHHKIPLATADTSRITKISDLAVLCSNCHRVIHRTSPMISVSDLHKHINDRKSNQEDAPD